MGTTLSDAWDGDASRNEALEVYAEYLEAVARELEATRFRQDLDDRLYERLRTRREELERRLK